MQEKNDKTIIAVLSTVLAALIGAGVATAITMASAPEMPPSGVYAPVVDCIDYSDTFCLYTDPYGEQTILFDRYSELPLDLAAKRGAVIVIEK